jgi:ribonuclease-3
MTKPEPRSKPESPKLRVHAAESGDDVEKVFCSMEQLLGRPFRDRALLKTALTHPSMRDFAKVSYERLEFLGDAVLGLVIAEHVYHRFPESDEGELTRIKSSVVSRAALAHLGKRLRIAEHLVMGKGMHNQGPVPRSVTANATEAMIGALYVDSGFDPAKEFVLRHLGDLIRRSSTKRPASNHKSLLQLHTQRLALGTPTYEVLAVSGPDHERTFEMRALLNGRVFPSAIGANKKKAEQRAAKLALRILEAEEKGLAAPAADTAETDDEAE